MAKVAHSVSSERLESERLADATVLVADDVAQYVARLGEGVDIADHVGDLVPPWTKTWIEMSGAQNVVNAKRASGKGCEMAARGWSAQGTPGGSR